MRIQTRLSRAVALLSLLVLTFAARQTLVAQQALSPAEPRTFAPNAVLPLDSAIRTGTLPNGQTYSVPVYGLKPGVTTRGGTRLENGDRE